MISFPSIDVFWRRDFIFQWNWTWLLWRKKGMLVKCQAIQIDAKTACLKLSWKLGAEEISCTHFLHLYSVHVHKFWRCYFKWIQIVSKIEKLHQRPRISVFYGLSALFLCFIDIRAFWCSSPFLSRYLPLSPRFCLACQRNTLSRVCLLIKYFLVSWCRENRFRTMNWKQELCRMKHSSL